MSLSPGDHLGPYRIVRLLGTGGMGAVYRAHDARLGRDAAIKVLHTATLSDQSRRARFLQEAKAASALNHPNIVTIYDIGTEGDVVFLVMELVDGQPLDELIPEAGLRVQQVLRIGVQIADACSAAHAAGIVHRDLKPANVMVQADGRVKVLDFGVAKLLEPADAPDTRTQTVQTAAGTIVGTAAYMSPEQAEAKPVDTRSDIFSFGALVYEAITGRRAFAGESAVATLAAVLQVDPAPPADTKAAVPPEVSRLIMRCLRKDPARRVQSMADLKVALEELRDEVDAGRLTGSQPIASGPPRSPRLAWLVAALAVAASVALAGSWLWSTRTGPEAEASAQPLPFTSYPGIESFPTFSPDGGQIAFMWDGERGDNPDIYVALIGGGSPLRLTNDSQVDMAPAWSPNGRHIAFLRRLDRDTFAVLLVPPLGGPERRIGQFSTKLFLGGAMLASLCWTPDSRYLFVSGSETPSQANQILRVAVDSGEVKTVVPFAGDDGGYISPALSPDGRMLAVTSYQSAEIELRQMSEDYEPGAMTKISASNVNPNGFAWTADSKELLLTPNLTSQPLYRVAAAGGTPMPLTWTGPGAAFPAVHAARMAFVRTFRDVNIVRLALASARDGQSALERIASSSFRDVAPQYSPDGKRIAFYSNRGGSVQIWTANADGSQAMPLTSMDAFATTGTPRWSPDGQQIAFDSNAGRTGEGASYQVYVVGADGGKPRALTSGSSSNFAAAWSPDGRWIYFSSTRGGKEQIWRVRPEGGEAEPVTRDIGAAPAISPDGRYLYFTRGDGAEGLWRMPIDGGDAVQVAPRLFRYSYAVGRDGVYYVTPRPDSMIRFVDPATGATRDVLALDKLVDLGLALSPDGRFLLFTQVDYVGQDLMLVENFR
jgi:eukaryotic-like serine/threonine-protein kinase